MIKIKKDLIRDSRAIFKMITALSKSFLILTFLSSVLKATLPFINIIFSYLILDGIILGETKEVLLNYVLYMAGLNLIIGILSEFLSRLVKIKTDYINSSVRAILSEKALTLDYEELEKKSNMDLLHRAKEGANSHGGIASYCENIASFFNHFVSLIYAIVLLVGLFKVVPLQNPSVMEAIFNSPYSTIGLFIILILTLMLNFKIMRKINKEVYAYFEKNVTINRIFNYFASLTMNYQFGKDIRIYKMDELIADEMLQVNQKWFKSMRELSHFYGRHSVYKEIVNQLIIFLTYVFVGIKAILGLITVGSIIMFVGALTKLHQSLSALINLWVALDLQTQYIKNYTTFLNLENKKYEGTLPIEKRDDHQYELEFQNVSFHYPNNDEMILKNINLKINVGKKMAIVGPNGAGKTTFIKLLCRLYDPTEGSILLNGIDIRKYDYKEYLDLFSVVFQDFKLFSFEVGQNVATTTVYDEESVWQVLEDAGVKNRIDQMKDGLHTTIYQNDEEGVEISGGEAQKIAIARALYKDASIIVLDEPTSALDPISEFEIYNRFNHLVTNKTSIYISHRMSSCRFCDHILVFDKGEIAQVGSHSSLMKDGDGLYFQLWNAQSKYYQ
jgi:ATP-binding cassette, subfamily B, bacterial